MMPRLEVWRTGCPAPVPVMGLRGRRPLAPNEFGAALISTVPTRTPSSLVTPQQHILSIELPVRDRFQFDFDARVQWIDPLDQVNVHDAAIVKP